MSLRLAMAALWAGGTSVPSPAGAVAPVFPSLFRDDEPPHWLTSSFWCSFLVWTCQRVVLHHLKCSYQIVHLRRDLPKLLCEHIPVEVIVTISLYAYHTWTSPTFSLRTLDIIMTSSWHHLHLWYHSYIITPLMTSFLHHYSTMTSSTEHYKYSTIS